MWEKNDFVMGVRTGRQAAEKKILFFFWVGSIGVWCFGKMEEKRRFYFVHLCRHQDGFEKSALTLRIQIMPMPSFCTVFDPEPPCIWLEQQPPIRAPKEPPEREQVTKRNQTTCHDLSCCDDERHEDSHHSLRDETSVRKTVKRLNNCLDLLPVEEIVCDIIRCFFSLLLSLAD